MPARTKTAQSAIKRVDYVGFDKGNGAVKLYIPCQNRAEIFQSVASPVDSVYASAMPTASAAPLIVDGRPWYAGIDPGDTTHPMPLHAGRDLTEEHMALFFEGLDRVGADEIGCIIMGVPVDQALDEVAVQRLIKRFQGKHIVRGREVNVKKVGAYAEPLGTAWAYVSGEPNIGNGSTVLLVDFGYGTTDIIVMKVDSGANGISIKIDESTAKNVWQGASQCCEAIEAAIKADIKVRVPANEVSKLLREKGLGAMKATINRVGHEIEMGKYIEPALKAQADDLKSFIMTKMRATIEDVDIILATGGFAQPMANIMEENSPRPIRVMKDPQTANARGFAMMASVHAKRA